MRAGSMINPFQWNGQYGYYTDQPNRLYVRNRHYRTDFVAKWISRDPGSVVRGLESVSVLLNIRGIGDPWGLYACPEHCAELREKILAQFVNDLICIRKYDPDLDAIGGGINHATGKPTLLAFPDRVTIS